MTGRWWLLRWWWNSSLEEWEFCMEEHFVEEWNTKEALTFVCRMPCCCCCLSCSLLNGMHGICTMRRVSRLSRKLGTWTIMWVVWWYGAYQYACKSLFNFITCIHTYVKCKYFLHALQLPIVFDSRKLIFGVYIPIPIPPTTTCTWKDFLEFLYAYYSVFSKVYNESGYYG